MKSRLIHPATAVLAAGLLLVSCSSSDSDSEDENIQGVETGDSQEPDDEEPSEEPEPTPSDGIDRPEIELPDDMNNVFEDTETGDPEQDAIIADVVQRINAIDMAISQSNPDLEAVEFYSAGGGLDSARNFIRGAAEANDTWTGTAEYYDFTVDTDVPNPLISFCRDSSEVQTRELDTGDVLPRAEDARDFGFIQVIAVENDLGVWQVTRVFPDDEELDQRCER